MMVKPRAGMMMMMMMIWYYFSHSLHILRRESICCPSVFFTNYASLQLYPTKFELLTIIQKNGIVGVSLTSINDKVVKSKEQDQTAYMWRLILLYTVCKSGPC